MAQLFSGMLARARNALVLIVVLQAATIVGLLVQTAYLSGQIADAVPLEAASATPAVFDTRRLEEAIEAAQDEASRARTEAARASLAADMAAGSAESASDGVSDILRLGVTCN